MARMASGGQHGLAQSLFQVGGNAGQSIGPLLAAFIVIPGGQRSVAWFTLVAITGIVLQFRIGAWYKARLVNRGHAHDHHAAAHSGLSTAKIRVSIAVLLALMFSKFFYLASIGSYYTFYLIDKFHLTVRNAQYCLFVFLASVAAGTIIGGPIGDRIGRKLVIWCSILGVLPFSLLLPHASLALDSCTQRSDRRDSRVGFSGHHRLCAGTAARARGARLGAVFRICIWYGRHWCGGPGAVGGPNQHRFRVSGVRFPARYRTAHGLTAKSGSPQDFVASSEYEIERAT